MSKTLLITGSTDGIGLATARKLVTLGHHVLLHGRNPDKLENARHALSALPGGGRVDAYVADLSRLAEVSTLAQAVSARHTRLDVLINNAGVFKSAETTTPDGLDVRFAVNTLAPYRLTQQLMPLLGASGRVINLSSAAQSPVDLDALTGRIKLADDYAAYAQSKLVLTMWSRSLARALDGRGPTIVAVNPGSMLGTKMVTEGFGLAGADIGIGADILVRAALSDEFGEATGRYFDNDSGRFSSPHADALDAQKSEDVVGVIESILAATT